MGRISTRQPTTVFGEWLVSQLDRLGWERKTLAVKSSVGITTVNQLIAGVRNPSREMVERLAHALSPEDTDDHAVRGLLNAGLRAAGFSTDVDIEREPFLDQIREAGVIEDLPPETQQEILDFMRFKAEQARQRREGD